MTNFEKAIEDLLGVEGGYVNHPTDRGGPTNWGITLGVLSEWRGKKVTALDVKNMPRSEAIEIYKAKYWDSINLDKIKSSLIAELVFDQSVNRGPLTAAKNLQESYNNISKVKIAVDGKIGPLSVSAINNAKVFDLAIAFFKDAQLDYATIVQKNRTQADFIRGWTNRTHALLDNILTEAIDEQYEELEPAIIEPVEFNLLDEIIKHNPIIERKEMERALSFLPQAKKQDHMLYVDFDLNSKDERAYLIDLKTGKSILKEQTTVGKYSDANHDGWAEAFGNVSGSGKSSLGAMLTGEEYGKSIGGWSKFKYARKLDGLEIGLNHKVRERVIVIHNSPYAETGGRSLGCITFNEQSAKTVIDTLGVGSLVYCNHESLKKL